MDNLRNFVGRGLAAAGRAISNEDLNADQPREDMDPGLREARRGLEMVQLERDRLLADEERQAALARQRQRERQHEEGAFYTLCERMIGKKMDGTWQAFATNVVSDYLDRNNLMDPQYRFDTITRVISRFLNHIHNEQRLTLNNVLDIQDRNRDIDGVIDQTVWYNPWTWHLKQSIQENINGSWREHRLYSTTQVVAMMSLGAGAIAIGSYCTFKVLQRLSSIITTPKVTPPPMPRMQIDIPQLSLMTTSLDRLADCINTSANSGATQLGLPDSNMSTESVTPVREGIIKLLGIRLNKVGESLAEFARSLK
jgi:hypothetical protein